MTGLKGSPGHLGMGSSVRLSVRGVCDKFEDSIDNILNPKSKVWSTLSLYKNIVIQLTL